MSHFRVLLLLAFGALEHHLLRLVHLLILLEKRFRALLFFIKCEQGRELLPFSEVTTERHIDVRTLLGHIPVLYALDDVLPLRHDGTSNATCRLVPLQMIGPLVLPALATLAFLLRRFTLICL